MKRPPLRPMFLARRSYRLRRLRDAARMLPALAAFLFALPVLWGRPNEPRMLAWDAVYVFLVWAGMIAIAALLAPRLEKPGEDADPASAEDQA